MSGVLAPAGAYRAAVAELPLSTRLVDHFSGAIVVVPGSTGWVDVARAAAAAGAAAVVIADPAFAPAAEVRRLAQETRIPVIVERPMLRADTAADARAFRVMGSGWTSPRMVAAEGTAPHARVRIVVRDAIGWLRVLSSGELALVAADRALALLETREGVPATLSVVETSRPGSGWIRAQALGETIIEVQGEGSRSGVVGATASGSVVSPTRFESSERLALRRALDALAAGEGPDDLTELAADTEHVERMLPPAP